MEYGLCFSGGGGKGAYEMGVWRALKQLDKVRDIVAVSGASIGAVNGLLFTAGDYEKAQGVWSQISNKDFWQSGLDNGSICSRDRLSEILHKEVDFDLVKFSRVRFFVNTTITDETIPLPTKAEEVKPYIKQYIEHFTTEYFELNRSGKERIIETILASTSIPAVYKPMRIDGKQMIDGGLTDNVPIRPLIESCECKNLIIVMVGRDNEYDPYLASRTEKIIEIRPSEDIGGFIDGTLDFDNKRVRRRMLLGYYDTLRVFDMDMRKQLGMPYTEAEKLQSIQKDHDRIEAELNSELVVDKMQKSLKAYDDMLDKYSKRYKIEL